MVGDSSDLQRRQPWEGLVHTGCGQDLETAGPLICRVDHPSPDSEAGKGALGVGLGDEEGAGNGKD